MSRSPKFLDTVEACVAAVLEHAGSDLRLGAPLGLGKPNVLSATTTAIRSTCESSLLGTHCRSNQE